MRRIAATPSYVALTVATLALGLCAPTASALRSLPHTAGDVTLFPADAGAAITAGPDGNLWYAAEGQGVGRITPGGFVLYAHTPTGADTMVTGIATGPDGDIWFADNDSGYIGKLDPFTSRLTEYPTPTPPQEGGCPPYPTGVPISVTDYEPPFAITSGPSGDMWFTQGWGFDPTNPDFDLLLAVDSCEGNATPTDVRHDKAHVDGGENYDSENEIASGANLAGMISQITPTGRVTQHAIGALQPVGIAAGPDGDLWFTQQVLQGGSGVEEIGRMTPSGTITYFPIPGGGDQHAGTQLPYGIAVGPAGDLWFTLNVADQIGRLTPSGQMTIFDLPDNLAPQDIALGPDGDMWFTSDGQSPQPNDDATPPPSSPAYNYTGPYADLIGSISAGGIVSEYAMPTGSLAHPAPAVQPEGITAGPDGAMWFTSSDSNEIGRVATGVSPASSHAPSVTNYPEVAAHTCEGARWRHWAGEKSSLTALPEDGYSWTVDGQVVKRAVNQSYVPPASDAGKKLACTVTVTYPVLNVTVSATSAAVVIDHQSGPTIRPRASA